MIVTNTKHRRQERMRLTTALLRLKALRCGDGDPELVQRIAELETKLRALDVRAHDE
jgi:hypothetical protein